jgi:NAD(P)-dependent dehydrogenase (short-subunit alcohol dehydrogenase family)
MRVLVTGSNRGLGYEFVRQYLELGYEVIATCRFPKKAESLQKLKSSYENRLTIIKLDVSDKESIKNAYETVENGFSSVDLIINNAGIISGDGENEYPLGKIHTENVLHILNVNSVGPLLISEQFLDLLQKGTNPKIVNISSGMGSIGQKIDTSRYSYCMSKAALNMASKMLSIELKSKGIAVWSIHPGWNRTDMGGSGATLNPKNSVASMIKIIDSKTVRDTGKFLDWNGSEYAW